MRFKVFRRLTWRGMRWFWHLKADNNRIIASGQAAGFARKIDAVTICRQIGKSTITEIEGA
jgi:uncharacterized protein YegP (UPF0339 family)